MRVVMMMVVNCSKHADKIANRSLIVKPIGPLDLGFGLPPHYPSVRNFAGTISVQ